MKLSSAALVFFASVNYAQTPAGQDTKPKLIESNEMETEIEFPEDQQTRQLSVANNFRFPLHYVVKNDSMFFLLESVDQTLVIENNTQVHNIIVTPNIHLILNNKKLLLKEKYIEEHITIYNKNRLSERYSVFVRLTFGQMTDFYSAPTPKLQYPFETLERIIVNFLKEFKTFWKGYLSDHAKFVNAPELTLLECLSKADTEVDDNQLYFTFYYITDELAFYGLKKHAGKWATHLADMLFFSLFKFDELFSPIVAVVKMARDRERDRNDKKPWTSSSISNISLKLQFANKWIGRLSFFLGFFAEQQNDLTALRTLELELNPSTFQSNQ